MLLHGSDKGHLHIDVILPKGVYSLAIKFRDWEQSRLDLRDAESPGAALSAVAVAQRISHMLKLYAAPIASARAHMSHEN